MVDLCVSCEIMLKILKTFIYVYLVLVMIPLILNNLKYFEEDVISKSLSDIFFSLGEAFKPNKTR